MNFVKTFLRIFTQSIFTFIWGIYLIVNADYVNGILKFSSASHASEIIGILTIISTCVIVYHDRKKETSKTPPTQ